MEKSLNKRIILALIVACAIITAIVLSIKCFNPIISISSFNQIKFDAIKPDTLVIFDADETLIQPIDSYYINEFAPQAIEFKKNFIAQHPEIIDWDEFTDVTIEEVQRPLIEPPIIGKIKELQKKRHSCNHMHRNKYWQIWQDAKTWAMAI